MGMSTPTSTCPKTVRSPKRSAAPGLSQTVRGAISAPSWMRSRLAKALAVSPAGDERVRDRQLAEDAEAAGIDIPAIEIFAQREIESIAEMARDRHSDDVGRPCTIEGDEGPALVGCGNRGDEGEGRQ